MAYRDDEAAALAELRVARPCRERWDEMHGEAHVRHCGRCDKDVFDLSGMTRAEIADLLYRRGADLCARFYRAPHAYDPAPYVDVRPSPPPEPTHPLPAVLLAAAAGRVIAEGITDLDVTLPLLTDLSKLEGDLVMGEVAVMPAAPVAADER